MRKWLALSAGIASLLTSNLAPGQEPATDALPSDVHIDIAPRPPEPKPLEAPSDAGTGAFAEAPPPRPRHKGLVLESTLGALGFGGQFRHVSPPAFWLHAQLGYEVLDWLMVFGEGELAFTSTSESQDESQSMAFPLYGFGGGVRATAHPTQRFAIFGQSEIDGLAADVPHDSLTILGFRNAETLAASFGVRAGVEWYQIDRHLALCAQIGGRVAEGFAKVTASNDLPLMWDAAVGVRYTF